MVTHNFCGTKYSVFTPGLLIHIYWMDLNSSSSFICLILSKNSCTACPVGLILLYLLQDLLHRLYLQAVALAYSPLPHHESTQISLS